MGGKDSPPPFVVPQQQQQQDQKVVEMHTPEGTSSFSSSIQSLSRVSLSTPSLTLRRESSPIQYVPKSKSAVNVQCDITRSTSTLDGSCGTLPRPNGSSTLSRGYSGSSSGLNSPVRTYMDCVSPQSLKVVLVGDSEVGKTSILLSYTVEKFLETYSPTIYDKFSSEW